MDEYQPTAKLDIAETCAASISIQDLIDLSENKDETKKRLDPYALKLNYGDIRGSDALRKNLAGLYSARASGVTKVKCLVREVGDTADDIREHFDHQRSDRRELSGALHVT